MERSAWELWKEMYSQAIIGRVKLKPFDEFLRSVKRPHTAETSLTPEEIEAEMLKVVTAYEANASRSRPC